MIRIYIAGAYSAGNIDKLLENRRNGLSAAIKLLGCGYGVYAPWLDFELATHADIPSRVFAENSMEWLRVSEAVYIVPGWEESTGTKREIAEATSLGIPIFYNLYSLFNWAGNKGLGNE